MLVLNVVFVGPKCSLYLDQVLVFLTITVSVFRPNPFIHLLLHARTWHHFWLHNHTTHFFSKTKQNKTNAKLQMFRSFSLWVVPSRWWSVWVLLASRTTRTSRSTPTTVEASCDSRSKIVGGGDVGEREREKFVCRDHLKLIYPTSHFFILDSQWAKQWVSE